MLMYSSFRHLYEQNEAAKNLSQDNCPIEISMEHLQNKSQKLHDA
jgi:hypothetical protein